MNKQKALLEKLRALAKSGVGGEKLNAEHKLKELMEKYGVTEEELEEETIDSCYFHYRGAREKSLLAQIMFKVTNSTDIYRCSAGKTYLSCKTTAAKKIEIEFLFDFYKRLWRKEEEFFFSCFVQKHRLFGEKTDDTDEKDIDDEELWRMSMIIQGMKDETPVKQIPQKT